MACASMAIEVVPSTRYPAREPNTPPLDIHDCSHVIVETREGIPREVAPERRPMKLSRKTFWGLSILLLGVLPLLITGGLIYRGDRQQTVDRALITAIKKNNVKAVIALLAKGADPNTRDWPPYVEFLGNSSWGGHYNPSEPQTALMVTLALNGENVPLTKTLLDAGASVDATDEYGRTALTCAASVSKRASVRLLMERGANVNVSDHDGDTALHTAADQKDVGIVQLLLARDARVNARDSEGVVPLHNAAFKGQTDIVGLLLAHRGAVDVRDNNGSAPLHYAARGGSRDCVAALILRGAQMNMKDGDGDTPLSIAVRYSRADCVRSLLAGGALVNTKNNAGQTPLAYALASQNKQIVKMLTDAGAKK